MPGWKAKCWSRPNAFGFTIVCVLAFSTADTQIRVKFEKSMGEQIKKRNDKNKKQIKLKRAARTSSESLYVSLKHKQWIICMAQCEMYRARACAAFNLSCWMHFISIQILSMVCHWCHDYYHRWYAILHCNLFEWCTAYCLKLKMKTKKNCTKETAHPFTQ